MISTNYSFIVIQLSLSIVIIIIHQIFLMAILKLWENPHDFHRQTNVDAESPPALAPAPAKPAAPVQASFPGDFH